MEDVLIYHYRIHTNVNVDIFIQVIDVKNVRQIFFNDEFNSTTDLGSYQGIQVIACGIIILIALVILYLLEPSSCSCSTSRQINGISRTKKTSRIRFQKSKRWISIILSIILTVIICLFILQTNNFIPEDLFHSNEFIRFCLLYENNSYRHLLTFPLALVIIFLMIFYQTRRESRDQWKINIPIPFNPFSKINRFDTMILSALLSHEILEILHEILQIRQLTIHGPLFELIRQVGLIIIISLRYYPIYSILELTNNNIISYLLCTFYMWFDLILRIFQQTICVKQRNQFTLNSSIIHVIKYTPYYLCLTYISCRLMYLSIRQISRSFHCRRNPNEKHIYHEPTFPSQDHSPSIESQYVQYLFNPHPQQRSFFHRIYRSHPYFHYSKQILNIYILAWMLIYYLTLNLLQNAFHFLEKIYNFISIPLLIIFEELDLPEAKPSNFKIELIISCLLAGLIYSMQLFFAMRKYQKNMLDAYRGRFLDIPPRSVLAKTRYLSKNIHYPGYFIAYLIFGYVIIGNLVFFLLIALKILCRHLFLIEELAKITFPILAFYLIKLIIQWFLCRTLSFQK